MWRGEEEGGIILSHVGQRVGSVDCVHHVRGRCNRPTEYDGEQRREDLCWVRGGATARFLFTEDVGWSGRERPE
eukprot:3313396-Pyramimonas_sp.AAC.1